METAPDEGHGPSSDLQFDRAEYAAPNVDRTCSACNQGVGASYYEVNGTFICGVCRESLQAALTGGSGARRFFRAALFGSLAGAVGAGIYYAVAALTGYEFGLIAIVVGLLVGGAVRKGCDQRGGWLYQLLAMYVTYVAIVSTYVPLIIQAGREHKNVEKLESVPEQPAAEDVVANPGLGQAVFHLMLALLVLLLLAHCIPILAGFQNLMGLIIIGIALYEAWKINKRLQLEITGPYQVGTSCGLPQPHNGIPDHV